MEKKTNENSKQYLDNIVETVYDNLRDTEMRPCIAFHTTPKHFLPQEAVDWEMVKEEEDSMEDSSLDSFIEDFR